MAWLGLPQVADGAPHAGPLAGLVAGLERAAHPLVAAVAVDMPFASPPLFTLLASLADGHDAAVPVGDRGVEPLHAVYATSARPVLRAALQEHRLAVQEALADLDVRTVEEGEWRAADPSGRFADNLNDPDDLRRTR
jgi:molybdopterin-guanine dinucleotide biosynthesis protein A